MVLLGGRKGFLAQFVLKSIFVYLKMNAALLYASKPCFRIANDMCWEVVLPQH